MEIEIKAFYLRKITTVHVPYWRQENVETGADKPDLGHDSMDK